jgi:DNA-binding transcriptional LysR family regulator
MDIFQAMKTFTAVVEAGSFVGAMDAVGLSKPAVSRHVNELEAHLGTRLLQRTTRRLSLTGEGEAYYQRCKEILLAVQEAEGEVGSSALQAQGRLRIGAPQTFGALHLAALWGRFAAENPQVTLDIVLSDRIVDLVEEGYDLVIRIARLSDSSFVSRRLARTRMVLCASPQYLAKHGTPAHPHELARHDVISYTYWSSGDNWTFDGPGGDTTVRTHSRIHANNGDTCRAAALAHQGIILQPDFLVYDDLQSGALVELMPDFRAAELGIFAVYPTRKQLPLKVRRLVDFLVDALLTPPWFSSFTESERS